MTDAEFAIWLLFMLTFMVLPIKPVFIYLFKKLSGNEQQDTTPCIEEERYNDRHYSQLYRPSDKKYQQIVELSNKAKSISH